MAQEDEAGGLMIHHPLGCICLAAAVDQLIEPLRLVIHDKMLRTVIDGYCKFSFYCRCDKVANNFSKLFIDILNPSVKPISIIFSIRASDSL
jgi:hypothetical protein